CGRAPAQDRTASPAVATGRPSGCYYADMAGLFLAEHRDGAVPASRARSLLCSTAKPCIPTTSTTATWTTATTATTTSTGTEWGFPSLFCWAVVRPDSYEPGLMKAQYSRHEQQASRAESRGSTLHGVAARGPRGGRDGPRPTVHGQPRLGGAIASTLALYFAAECVLINRCARGRPAEADAAWHGSSNPGKHPLLASVHQAENDRVAMIRAMEQTEGRRRAVASEQATRASAEFCELASGVEASAAAEKRAQDFEQSVADEAKRAPAAARRAQADRAAADAAAKTASAESAKATRQAQGEISDALHRAQAKPRRQARTATQRIDPPANDEVTTARSAKIRATRPMDNWGAQRGQ
ncbi:unnamed protein product, partial [Prorocentrum cordatum]